MADYTCKIRIYLPLQDNLCPNQAGTGHFDIQIMKSNFSVFGRTYTNPVISYAGNGVTIANGTKAVIPPNHMLCYLAVTVSDSDVSKLITDWLEEYCQNNNSDVYPVVKGDFKTYTLQRYNCFGAVADWMNVMGEPYLKSIHTKYSNSGDGYKNYTAWPMFKTYYKAWVFDTLNI